MSFCYKIVYKIKDTSGIHFSSEINPGPSRPVSSGGDYIAVQFYFKKNSYLAMSSELVKDGLTNIYLFIYLFTKARKPKARKISQGKQYIYN